MRIRCVILLASLALVTAACSDANESSSQQGGAKAATETTTTMHDMDNMEPAIDVAKPLPLLQDGTLDPDGVDLSGIEGVTPEQQAFAEEVLVRSIETLPRWADYDETVAAGFKSIGDGPATGEEHVIMYEWVNDDAILDPNKPESLVYKYETLPDGTPKRTLEAAMFILPDSYTLETAPTDGGALMQYHNHQNLCYTAGETPRVAGITNADGNCAEGLVLGAGNIQIHVWIRANDCGPFAALKGIGAGQVKQGDDVTCLSEHGSAGH